MRIVLKDVVQEFPADGSDVTWLLDADLVGAGRAFAHRLTRAESEP